MQALSRVARLTSLATILAVLVATLAIGPAAAATCPSGFPNGPYGGPFPYCADVTSAPGNGTSYITLYFIAPSPFVDQLTIETSSGVFIGGTGVFAASSYPTTQVLHTFISMDSQLRLASSVAGTAVVTVSYVSFGSTFVDSVTPFTFTALLQTPTTKSDCMGGGWRELVNAQGLPFKNQGACIAFVAGS